MGDPVVVAAARSDPGAAELLVRRRSRSLPARVLYRLGDRLREAQELGSYQLVRAARAGRHGRGVARRATACSRAARRSSWCGRKCSARGTKPRRASMLRRFEREAQATASLSSPHTIDVFDFGVTDEGTFYYVMELLAGRDLETLVREFGPVPAERDGVPAAAGVPLAGRRARARHGAPRHQAGEHLRLPHGARVRFREGARLRPGEAARARRRRPSRC